MTDAAENNTLEARVVQSIIDLREERGWSQSELARRMVEAGWPKYTQMTVSRTEKGERPIRLDEADALAGVFGMELYQLQSPRSLRLYMTSHDLVDRLAKELEDLVLRYLFEQGRLAARADMIQDFDITEISYVAAQLLDTPEAIVRRARLRMKQDGDRLHEDLHDNLNDEVETAAEDRFWNTPEGDRRLTDLLGDLHGEHQETR